MYDSEDAAFALECADDVSETRQEFINTYQSWIRSVVISVVKRFSYRDHGESDIEDFVQDVFLSLFEEDARRLRSFKGRHNCSLKTWLRTVVSHRILNHIRKHSPAVKMRQQAPVDLEAPSTAPATDDLLTHHQALSFVKKALEELPARDRLIFSLIFEDGCSYDEVASICRMEKSAVYTRLSRLRKTLRNKAEKAGIL